jgi:hypothetical protein
MIAVGIGKPVGPDIHLRAVQRREQIGTRQRTAGVTRARVIDRSDRQHADLVRGRDEPRHQLGIVRAACRPKGESCAHERTFLRSLEAARA